MSCNLPSALSHYQFITYLRTLHNASFSLFYTHVWLTIDNRYTLNRAVQFYLKVVYTVKYTLASHMVHICIYLDLRLIERFNGHEWRDKIKCIDYYGPMYAHNNRHILVDE